MAKDKDGFLKEEYRKLMASLLERSTKTLVPDYSLELKRYWSQSILKSAGSFYELLSKDCEPPGKPIVGYFCTLVPEEIILANGGIPQRICSSDSVCAGHGEELVSADICPVIKSICGAFRAGKHKNLDLMVIPAACDGKNKLTEILGTFSDIYFLDLPREGNYLNNSDVWTDKYRQFHQFLKKRYNQKTTRKNLLTACAATNRRTDLFRKIYDFRGRNAGIINSFDYFVMTYASFLLGPDAWAEKAEKVYIEALNTAKNRTRPNVKRILLAGSPIIFPNFKIPEILESSGCDLSAEILCSAYGKMYDPVVIDEETENGIIRSLALKYIAASMCPCLLSINKTLDRIIEVVREYSLDGVIYHTLRLCQTFEIQSGIIRQVLKENDVPSLFLKTDLGKEDTGQLMTRVEAFLEIIK
ncbi:MAG: 2-hydroxyacyl-CoA dehydratase family protein [Candidatus Omnitrophota bacterium]